MTINWKDPKIELPNDGEIIAVMIYHWKENWPQSAEIYFGEVESHYYEEGERNCRVVNCDYIGNGSEAWYFCQYRMGDMIHAWAPASDFKKPQFVNEK